MQKLGRVILICIAVFSFFYMNKRLHRNTQVIGVTSERMEPHTNMENMNMQNQNTAKVEETHLLNISTPFFSVGLF